MEKLQAVRILDRGVGCSIVGYTSRGKNRKAVWVFHLINKNPDEIKVQVAQAEAQRARDFHAEVALAKVNGDVDDS